MAKKETKKPATLEQEYLQTFAPRQLPYQGLYTDEDSLEQPSPLKYFPSTATPGIEMDIKIQMRRHAELE